MIKMYYNQQEIITEIQKSNNIANSIIQSISINSSSDGTFTGALENNWEDGKEKIDTSYTANTEYQKLNNLTKLVKDGNIIIGDDQIIDAKIGNSINNIVDSNLFSTDWDHKMFVTNFPTVGNFTYNVRAMCVWNNELYLGSDNTASDSRVWKYNGTSFEVFRSFYSGNIRAMCVWNNELYLGSGKGGIYRYYNAGFELSGTFSSGNIRAMCVYKGSMYIGSDGGSSNLYMWGTGDTFITIGSFKEGDILSMIANDTSLYLGCKLGGETNTIWEYNMTTFTKKAVFSAGNISSMVILNSNLYIGSDNTTGSKIWTYDDKFVEFKDFSNDLETMCVWNNELYIGCIDSEPISNLYIYKPLYKPFNGNALYNGLNPIVSQLNKSNDNIFNPFGEFTVDEVYSLCVWNGNLYIGSDQVYKYDGTSFKIFASPPSGLRCLCVWNNELYLGSDTTSKLYKFNGSIFEPIETFTRIVYSLCVWNGDLYIGSNTGTSYLYKYDGTSFVEVGSFTAGTVYSLGVYNNELYLGSSNGVYIYNGNTFDKISISINIVYSLCVWNGDLYLGSYRTPDDSYVYKYNGTAYEPIGNFTEGTVYSLCVWNGDLYLATDNGTYNGSRDGSNSFIYILNTDCTINTLEFSNNTTLQSNGKFVDYLKENPVLGTISVSSTPTADSAYNMSSMYNTFNDYVGNNTNGFYITKQLDFESVNTISNINNIDSINSTVGSYAENNYDNSNEHTILGIINNHGARIDTKTIPKINTYNVSSTDIFDSIGNFSEGTVFSLCVYNNELYLGSSNTDGNSKVWKYKGTTFDPIGKFTAGTVVTNLCVWNNELYLGTFTDSGSTIWILNTTTNTFDKFKSLDIGDGYGLCVWNNELYLGSNEGNTSYIYRYNGNTFEPFGSFKINKVHTLCVWNNELYIGTNNNSGSSIYKYNGISFEEFGSFSEGTVFSLCVYNNELYLGSNNNTGDSKVWKYNGTTFEAFGNFENGDVNALCVYNNELYLGSDNDSSTSKLWKLNMNDYTNTININTNYLNPGSYMNLGIMNRNHVPFVTNNLGVNTSCVWNGELYIGNTSSSGSNGVFKYDGKVFNSFGGFANIVYDMCVWKNKLYIVSPEHTKSSVYIYNGTSFDPFGGFSLYEAHTICVYNGELYITAFHTVTDPNTDSTIYKYNGNTFDPFGNFSLKVYSSIVYNGELYVGTDSKIFRYDKKTSKFVSFYNLYALSMVVYNGELYVGTDKGEIWKYSNNSSFTFFMNFGVAVSIKSLSIYNNEIITSISSTAPKPDLYKFPVVDAIALIDVEKDFTNSDIPALCVWNEKLYITDGYNGKSKFWEYNGTTLKLLDNYDDLIMSLCVWNEKLYGVFTGFTGSAEIKIYNNLSWDSLITIDNSIQLFVYNNKLYSSDFNNPNSNIYIYNETNKSFDIIQNFTNKTTSNLFELKGELYVCVDNELWKYNGKSFINTTLLFNLGSDIKCYVYNNNLYISGIVTGKNTFLVYKYTDTLELVDSYEFGLGYNMCEYKNILYIANTYYINMTTISTTLCELIEPKMLINENNNWKLYDAYGNTIPTFTITGDQYNTNIITNTSIDGQYMIKDIVGIRTD